ncbi:uncharacterized protein LOC135081903 [Ostrinia nubilalis]|uniref:uncharacterized protein LOC135081903 n=1 Tax=Ostrinia nubilalis TaxID=29057 RepID=UPI0030823431
MGVDSSSTSSGLLLWGTPEVRRRTSDGAERSQRTSGSVPSEDGGGSSGSPQRLQREYPTFNSEAQKRTSDSAWLAARRASGSSNVGGQRGVLQPYYRGCSWRRTPVTSEVVRTSDSATSRRVRFGDQRTEERPQSSPPARGRRRCQICKRKHHSLLHSNGKFISEASEDKEQGSSAVVSCTLTEEAGGAEGNITSCFSANKTGKQVLLAIAVVNIEANNGTRRTVRALLDQGSQASFVTEATIQGLGLKKTKTKNVVSGLGGDKKVIINSTVNINLQSRVNPEIKFKVKAYVLRKITAFLPAKKVGDLEGLDLTGLTLADPEYHTPNKVDILLGADVYGQILQEGLRKGIQGGVIAQSTALGWIISGTDR